MLFLRHAWRSWRTSTGVGALAVIALGIGIGSAVAIYTIVNAVLLKPLPFQHGERYVVLYAAPRGDESHSMSGETYKDLTIYQQRAHSFDMFGWFSVLNDYNLTSPGQPQHIHGIEVTPSLVNNLGVNPVLGRWFQDVSKEPDGAQVAVISQTLWKRLGRDPNIIGKSIDLDGKSYRVTGVAPPGFRVIQLGDWSLDPEDVWVPIDPHGKEQDESHAYYLAYARLRPGVTLPQAAAEVRAIAAQIAHDSPAAHPDYTARIRSLHEAVGSEVRPALLLLLGASGLLLLITCANVSGLLVARSLARARDTAVRVALGAGRGELALQFFLEGLFVAVAGGVLGVLAAWGLLRLVTAFEAEHIPRANEIRIDATVLLFAVALACLAALLASLAPLWQALHTQPNDVLNEGMRASAGRRSNRISRVLVVAEIALAFTLVCAAAILTSHLNALLHLWPGFNPDHLLTFQLQAIQTQYPNDKAVLAYQRNLLAKLENTPGVQSAAISAELPLTGCCFNVNILPRRSARQDNTPRSVNLNVISAQYFGTLQIGLAAGRFLNEHDTGEKPIHVVINQSAARTIWPGRSSVGESGYIGTTPGGNPFEIVGIVKDVHSDDLERAIAPEIYVLSDLGPPNPMHIVVRSSVPPNILIPRVRQAIRDINPSQPLYDVAMATAVVHRSVALQQATSSLTGFFGIASLLLAALGVYGVMSYFVRQRTVELGTRMALGAVPADLLRLVLKNAGTLALWGVGIGALGATLAAWLLINRFEVTHLVWSSFAYPIVTVGFVTAIAALYPGWRASLLSPMVAIRNEPETMWRSARQRVRDLFGQLSQQSAAYDPLLLSETTLLTEFVDAARRADSFDAALHAVLEMLCRHMQTGLAILLEHRAGDAYDSIASIPSGMHLQLPASGFLLNRLRSYTLPLPLTEQDFATWLKWAAEQRPAHLSELTALRDSGARLAVPLRTRTEVLGILLLGARQGGDYTPADKRVLRACAEQLALMLENGRLTNRIVEQEKLRRDVALAAEVQRRLLPETSPAINAGELAAFTLPARTVGGDYYDFVQSGDHRIGIAVADVAGKGVAAALITSVVHASLRILSSDGLISLPELTSRMNRFLHGSTGSNSYATFFYAQLNEETHELKYVNAGHNPPFLLRRQGAQVETLSEGGMMIGLFPQAAYSEGAVRLAPGDVLFIFTDGVTEALNPAEEEFGEVRLQQLLQSVVHLPVQEMSTRISDTLRTWIATADQHDDLTFVLLKIEPHC